MDLSRRAIMGVLVGGAVTASTATLVNLANEVSTGGISPPPHLGSMPYKGGITWLRFRGAKSGMTVVTEQTDNEPPEFLAWLRSEFGIEREVFRTQMALYSDDGTEEGPKLALPVSGWGTTVVVTVKDDGEVPFLYQSQFVATGEHEEVFIDCSESPVRLTFVEGRKS